MKNIKKVLFLTLVTSIGTLTGCNSNSGGEMARASEGASDIIIPTPDETKSFGKEEYSQPDELMLNAHTVSIMVKEETDLRCFPQLHYSGQNVSYVCENPEIASVDENGHIKGLKAGKTTITVTDKDNPNLTKEVPVIVSGSLTSKKKTQLIKSFKDLEEPELKEIINNEIYESALYKNDVLQSYSMAHETLVASYDNAYFRITEKGGEIIVEGGAYDFEEFEYIFTTNAYYDTVIFKSSGDVKNYLPIATQSYMGGERYVPLLEVMDNFFVAGDDIFTDLFEYAGLTDVATMAENESEGFVGSASDDSLFFISEANWPNDSADQDDETDDGIPYGTPMNVTQTMRFTIVDYKVSCVDILVTKEYKIGEDNYKSVLHMIYSYERVDEQKSQLYVPNRKDYTWVSSIFDL